MTSLRTKYNLEKFDEENPEMLIEGCSENKILYLRHTHSL